MKDEEYKVVSKLCKGLDDLGDLCYFLSFSIRRYWGKGFISPM